MADSPGSSGHIGPYELRGRLGSGGMGDVYLAWDERLGRHVAVKRIRHDVESTPERRSRFRREARAAAGLSHPAIVQIHDVLEGDDGDAIVMEYVEGHCLARLWREGRIDAARAVDLARQVAEGLARAHERGVVHRDLKAENVMVTPDGGAKILDFGLAKPLVPFDDTLTREGAVLGTLRTMSPEQAGGEEVDARSDLFSLGVMLYELLTGLSPFQGGNALQTQKRILTVRVPPPRAQRPDIPEELSALVEALLEKEPDRRPQSAAEVARTLATIAASGALRSLAPAPPASGSESVAPSDAPTVSADPAVISPSAGPLAGPPESTTSFSEILPRTGRRILVAAIVLAAVVTLVVRFLPEGDNGGGSDRLPMGVSGRGQPLLVLVSHPEKMGEGPENAESVALAVHQASLGALLGLRGIEPLDAEVSDLSPGLQSSGVSADEVLSTSLDFRDGSCWIAFKRYHVDGRVLSASEVFEVPVRPEFYLQVANAVAARLQRLYSGYEPRTDAVALEVREADYVAFIELQRRSQAGEALGPEELEELEALVGSSPRFLEARLLAANVARKIGLFDRGLALLEEARALAPEDPRVLSIRGYLEARAGRPDAVAASLAELERLVPGDLRILVLRARLREQEGKLDEAVQIWLRLVEARPSWQYLYDLAEAQRRLGRHSAARGHLERLLEISPRNPLGLSKLGQLELVYGDLEKAERLLTSAAEIDPRERSNFNNLGTVLYLRGRYEAAAESFRRALEIEPGHPLTRLNLADALLWAGRRDAAMELYRELLAELERGDAPRADAMMRAQCLARLGRARQAVEVTQETLQRQPQNVGVSFQAAVIYTLTGDRNAALVNAFAALDLGFDPRWFLIPDLAPLRDDPEFLERLGAAASLDAAAP